MSNSRNKKLNLMQETVCHYCGVEVDTYHEIKTLGRAFHITCYHSYTGIDDSIDDYYEVDEE